MEEWAMARMLGVWTVVNNPERSRQDDLNLTVGGTITLASADLPGGLWTIRVRVMDDDPGVNDLVHTDNSFQFGVRELGPKPFNVGVIVPASKLRNSEPSSEDWAEIYCRVSANLGNRSTNWANSQNTAVRI
jgi:hypothetical protein